MADHYYSRGKKQVSYESVLIDCLMHSEGIICGPVIGSLKISCSSYKIREGGKYVSNGNLPKLISDHFVFFKSSAVLSTRTCSFPYIFWAAKSAWYFLYLLLPLMP